MRLLLISTVFPNPIHPTGGVFNCQMVRALEQQGYHVDVVSPLSWVDLCRNRLAWRHLNGDRPALQEGLHVHFPRYYYTPKVLRSWYGAFMWYSVRRTVAAVAKANPPDAVLGYWAHPDGDVAVRIARQIGCPCIVVVGGSDVLLLCRRSLRRRKVAGVLNRADTVLVVSQDLKSKVEGLGVDPGRVHLGWRGVDTEKFAPGNRAESRRRLGFPPDRSLLLWVGSMLPVKGLDVLLNSIRLLKDRGVDFRLLLVGDGPLESALRTQCAALRLNEHVTFVGPVLHDELPDWYRAADLFVLPSLSEGIPNVLLESIAAGLPFVASRVGGTPEIAEAGIDQLVPPNDPVALADAIQKQLVERRPYRTPRSAVGTWSDAARELVQRIESCYRSRESTQ